MDAAAEKHSANPIKTVFAKRDKNVMGVMMIDTHKDNFLLDANI